MTREEAIRFAEYAQIMADGKPDVQEFYKLAEAALRAQQEQERKTTTGEGLRCKYIVRKADTGEGVDGCFVLRPDRDRAAVAALRAYAAATDNDVLATDILNWVGRERNDPLILDELRKMDGEPVWCVSMLNVQSEWAILKVTEMSKTWFVAMAGASCGYGDKDTYGKTWLAYRHKPEEGTV